MECEAEDPTGHLWSSSPSLGPGEFGKSLCDEGVIATGRFAVLPRQFPTALVDQPVANYCHCVANREGPKVGSMRECLVIAPPHLFKSGSISIHWGGRVAEKGAEETCGGQYCELLRSLNDRHVATADVDATGKDIEATRNGGGLEVRRSRYRLKILQGRGTGCFVKGCLDHPRCTPQVHAPLCDRGCAPQIHSAGSNKV